jgi:hypothetical protein
LFEHLQQVRVLQPHQFPQMLNFGLFLSYPILDAPVLEGNVFRYQLSRLLFSLQQHHNVTLASHFLFQHKADRRNGMVLIDYQLSLFLLILNIFKTVAEELDKIGQSLERQLILSVQVLNALLGHPASAAKYSIL